MRKILLFFLMIPILIFSMNYYNFVDSRNVAMGNCGVALNESPQSLVFNPAAMHCEDSFVYSGEKSLLFGIDNFGEIVSSLKIKNGNSYYGLSYYQLTYSSFLKDSMMDIGMDYPLFKVFHLGIGIKAFLTRASTIDNAISGGTVEGKGYSVDLGSFLNLGILKIGFVWKNPISEIFWTTNLSTTDTFTENLPMDFRIGAVLKPLQGQTLSMDLYGTDRGYLTGLNFGYEYYLLNFFAIRFGYSNLNIKDSEDYLMGTEEQNLLYAKGYLTFGVGIDTNNITIDYSYTQIPILGNTNRITFSIRF